MNICTICPCCSHTLLHHITHHREYWFCRNCWQEMPDLESFYRKKCYRKANNLSTVQVGSWI